MSSDINILLNKDSSVFKEQQKVKKIKIIAFSLAIIVGISSFVIFLLTLYINPVAVKKEQETVKSQIARYQDEEAKLFIVNERVDNIKKIFQKRKDFSANIDAILARMPENLILEAIEMDEKKVTVTVSLNSLLSLDEFVDSLLQMAVDKKLSSFVLEAMTFDEIKNNYLVSLSLEF